MGFGSSVANFVPLPCSYWQTVVLATCGIRPPVKAFENTQSCLLLLADSQRGRVQSKEFICLSSRRRNIDCAWDSLLFQAVDRSLPSVAPAPLRHLDHTRHHLAPAGDADRPCQKQVPTRGRKRTPASAIDHPASTGETTRLYQNGPDASDSSGKDSSELETSPRHCPARDIAAVASPGLQALLEIQVQSNFCHTKDFH